MTRVSKAELQDRLNAAEAQVVSLQDELAQAALRVGDLEEELESTPNPEEELPSDVDVASDALIEANDAITEASNLLLCQSQQIEDLAGTVESLANMLAYADSVASTIEEYKGPDASRPVTYAGFLREDLSHFLEGHWNGDFKFETIMGEVNAEQEAVVIAGNEYGGDCDYPNCECGEAERAEQITGYLTQEDEGDIEVFLESLGSPDDLIMNINESVNRFGTSE